MNTSALTVMIIAGLVLFLGFRDQLGQIGSILKAPSEAQGLLPGISSPIPGIPLPIPGIPLPLPAIPLSAGQPTGYVSTPA